MERNIRWTTWDGEGTEHLHLAVDNVVIAADGLIVDAGEFGLAVGELGAADCGDTNCGGIGELLGAPTDERTGSPDLGAGQRLGQHGVVPLDISIIHII